MLTDSIQIRFVFLIPKVLYQNFENATVPSFFRNTLLQGVTAAAVAAAVAEDPACWRAVRAEDEDDDGDGGLAKKSGALAGA